MRAARCLFFLVAFVLGAFQAVYAQTTEFTYQGQLQNSSTPATGLFDFEFALFDTALGGAQIGSTNIHNGVSVASGIFSVNLNFGQSFPGGTRFLEIRLRQSGGGSFTTLSPRQPVSSAPYSIKSLSADNAATAANATNATNATNAVNATTATIATGFTGPLAGDVIGTQAATTVARLQGRNVASAQPNNGQVLKYNTTTSQWEPANDETASGGGGGTITGVTAGTGLTGGGASGSVTVGIANGGVGTGQLADGSVTDAKIVSVAASKITGTIPVAAIPAGSGSYIQNQNAGAQASSNFNISGTGTANILNAGTQYNIGGSRILSNPGTGNLFAGVSAGANSTGPGNAFFGSFAGFSNTTGNDYAFFGSQAGNSNTTGGANAFFGGFAGFLNTTGSVNSFFGRFAGFSNTTGSNNTVIGHDANVGSGSLVFATAIGAGAIVSTSNTVVLGRSFDTVQVPGNMNVAGTYNIGGSRILSNPGMANLFVGVSAGAANTAGFSNAFFGNQAGESNTTGGSNAFFGVRSGNTNTTGSNNTVIGNDADVGSGSLTFATAIGAGAIVSASNSVVLGRPQDIVLVPGFIRVSQLGSAGATSVCQNVNGTIATCSSSLRYKTNINRFGLGLSLISQLKPITFDWKDGGMQDLGLGAEDVAAIEPLLVTHNDKGEVEGVKYDRIGVILVNAVKEQQAQIEKQKKTIEKQASEISELKAYLCSKDPSAPICR